MAVGKLNLSNILAATIPIIPVFHSLFEITRIFLISGLNSLQFIDEFIVSNLI